MLSKNLPKFTIKNNIKIIKAQNKLEASQFAFNILNKVVDKKTVLFLSGGKTPDLLYTMIGESNSLYPGASAMIDERYGTIDHERSNLSVINKTKLPLYEILKGKNIEDTTKEYEKTVAKLFKQYPNKVAFMGTGADGHTAGIKPNLDYEAGKLVTWFDDTNGYFGKRVTLTFEALSEFNVFIIVALGEEKLEKLKQMFQGKDRKKLPAVFFTQTKAEVYLITDQDI